MQYISFRSARVLTGIANMLECFGIEVSDLEIAAAMHAPFIFHLEDGHYFAGSRLYQPRWINLALLPRGFRLETCAVSVDELPKLLRTQTTAMLKLHAPKDKPRLSVYTGYADGRYHFVNLQQRNGRLPDHFALSVAQLKRRLSPSVELYLIHRCEEQSVDFQGILADSLHSLATYIQQVQERLVSQMSRAEYLQNEEFWLTLLLELGPMAFAAQDEVLSNGLGSLHFHCCKPIYNMQAIGLSAQQVNLNTDLIRRCLLWYAELLLDHLLSACGEEEGQQLIWDSGLLDTWVFHCDPLDKSIDLHRNDFFSNIHH